MILFWLKLKNKLRSTWLIWTRSDHHAVRVDRAYDANDLYNASQGRWPK